MANRHPGAEIIIPLRATIEKHGRMGWQRVIQIGCHPGAPLQLWERGVVYVAGALQIKDRIASRPALLAGQLGPELAGGAEFEVIGDNPS